MNIKQAIATPGFMSETELAYLAFIAESCFRIVEVGSWRGRSARAIADNIAPGGTLTCVDTWADDAYGHVFPEDDPEMFKKKDWLWNEFQRYLDEYLGTTVHQLRMTSMDGARFLANQKFDFIFIDAGHKYEDIQQDILCWRPLLAEGGILAGHDYNPVHHPEVIQVVKELVPRFRVVDTIWTTEGA